MRPTNALLPVALSLPLALAAGCDRRPTPSPVVLEAAAQGGFEPGAARPADTYLAGPRPVEVNAPMVSPPPVQVVPPPAPAPVAPPPAPAPAPVPQVVIQLIVPYATDAAGNTGAFTRAPLPAGAPSSVIVVPVLPPGTSPYAVAPATSAAGATGSGATGSGATGSGATGTGATGSGATGTGATGTGATGSGATGAGAPAATTAPVVPAAPGPVQPSAPDDIGVGNTGPRGFQNNGTDRRDPGPPTVYGSP